MSHGDGRVTPSALSGFIASYQTVKVLNLGELWAIPIMLRLALIENLRRVADQISVGRAAGAEAGAFGVGSEYSGAAHGDRVGAE